LRKSKKKAQQSSIESTDQAGISRDIAHAMFPAVAAVDADIPANSCTGLMPEHTMQKEKLLLRERWESSLKL
jgi:hypothetical protein